MSAASAQLLHKLLTYAIQHNTVPFPSREFGVLDDFVTPFQGAPLPLGMICATWLLALALRYLLLSLHLFWSSTRLRSSTPLEPLLGAPGSNPRLAPTWTWKLKTELASVTHCWAAGV